MRDRPEIYQASAVSAIETAEVSTEELAVKTVSLRDLKPGMVVQDDIRAKNGLFLVGKSQVISDALLARLRNFAITAGLVEPFHVLVPVVPPVEREPVCMTEMTEQISR